MEEEEINYRFLRKIQQMEKKSPKLSDMKNNFYKDISNHLKNLEERLKTEENSQKEKILKEEITDFKKIVLNIYEQREKKILYAAITKARGGKPDIENMVEREKKFFHSILEDINRHRSIILSEKQKEEKENKNSKKEKRENSKKKTNTRPIVRITEDIPEFIGTDKKKYSLKKNDVLTISPGMCEMITKREVCKKTQI